MLIASFHSSGTHSIRQSPIYRDPGSPFLSGLFAVLRHVLQLLAARNQPTRLRNGFSRDSNDLAAHADPNTVPQRSVVDGSIVSACHHWRSR